MRKKKKTYMGIDKGYLAVNLRPRESYTYCMMMEGKE